MRGDPPYQFFFSGKGKKVYTHGGVTFLSRYRSRFAVYPACAGILLNGRPHEIIGVYFRMVRSTGTI